MAQEGYYELQVLDQVGWNLRGRFPMSDDDPLVLIRARAEAEAAAQEPEIRAVELFYEFIDAKTNEARRESVFTAGSVRTSSAPSSTPQTRKKILRTATAAGRTATAKSRAKPTTGKPKRPVDDEPDLDALVADLAPGPAVHPAAPPWWRGRAVMIAGSLAIATGATVLIWIGLSRELAIVPTLDTQPVQAGLLTVILLFCVSVLVWVAVSRSGLLRGSRPVPGPAIEPPPSVIAVPAPVPPAAPKPRAVDPAEAMVDAQQGRLLRFLRECLLQPGMRDAMASDGTLRDPHIVFGCHLFLLGAAEVCVTDTSSGVSDRSHLVKVMKAVMRAIGSPEDRAEAFVQRLEAHRKRPEEHTMILLGQLAMDHYLQTSQVQDGALTQALTRWALPSAEV